MIGDFLGLHRDDLESVDKRCIDVRSAREASTREVRSPDALSMTLLKLARLDVRWGDAQPGAFREYRPRTMPRMRHRQIGEQTGSQNLDRPHRSETVTWSRANRGFAAVVAGLIWGIDPPRSSQCPVSSDAVARPFSLASRQLQFCR